MRIFLYLILVAALAACNSKNKSNGTSSNTNENGVLDGVNYVVASFDKPVAFGQFPVYKITLYSNNTAQLHAIQNLKLDNGNYKAAVDQKTIDAFLKKATSMDFFSLNEKYDGNATDLPLRSVTIADTKTGKTKTVQFSQNFPSGLKDIENMFDNLIEELNWEKI
ncbi:MAG: DUF6438 domain-containing protein [Flavobacteriales bacterium]